MYCNLHLNNEMETKLKTGITTTYKVFNRIRTFLPNLTIVVPFYDLAKDVEDPEMARIFLCKAGIRQLERHLASGEYTEFEDADEVIVVF